MGTELKTPLPLLAESLPSAVSTYCKKTSELIADLPRRELGEGQEAAFVAWMSPADEYGIWMQTRQAGQLVPFTQGHVKELRGRPHSERAVDVLLAVADFGLTVGGLGAAAVAGHDALEPEIRSKRIFTKMDDRGQRTEFIPPHLVPEALDRICAVWNSPPHHIPPVLVALWLCVATTNAHPFRDGNGRLGRALMNAHLIRLGISSHGPIPFGALRYAAQGNLEKAMRYAEATGDWLPLVKVFYVLVGSYSTILPRYVRAVGQQAGIEVLEG